MATGTVILVPGLLASELRYPLPFLPYDALWLNPARIVAGGWDLLRMAVPGEDAPAPGEGYVLPGGPLPGLYTLMIQFLSNRGWRVVSPPQDWRRGLLFDAQLLVGLIRAESVYQPVRIVAHSRGGLVARRALQILADAGEGERVIRVISLGTPHTGSLVAAELMACYHPAKTTISNLSLYLASWFTKPLSPADVARAARSWPSVYQLLPTLSAPWLRGITPAQLYLPATWEGSPFSPVASYLSAAADNWNALPLNATGCDWVDVVGTGVHTPYGLRDGYDVRERGALAGDTDGDGAVRADSAHPISRPVIFTQCQHDLLPSDGRVCEQVHLALQGQYTGHHVCGGDCLRV